MSKLFVFILILAPFSISYAGSASSGLRLSGVVPLKADVTVTQDSLVKNKSSDGLKFEIKKRQPASVVVVSAP